MGCSVCGGSRKVYTELYGPRLLPCPYCDPAGARGAAGTIAPKEVRGEALRPGGPVPDGRNGPDVVGPGGRHDASGRSSLSGLITKQPCENCDDDARETETGAPYCRRSPSGDRECSMYQLVLALEEVALEVARKYRRISDLDARRELALSTADGFSNALHLMGTNADFSSDEFVKRCGLEFHG